MPMPRRQITFLLVLCLMLPACVTVTLRSSAPTVPDARPSPATATCPVPARSAADAPRLVSLINAERARAGLAALTLSPALSAVAHAFACEAAARGDIGHTGSDGSTLRERLARGGLASRMAAENNAAGQRLPEAVLDDWMASPHHRENILRPDARQIGVGQADGPWPVWITDFTS